MDPETMKPMQKINLSLEAACNTGLLVDLLSFGIYDAQHMWSTIHTENKNKNIIRPYSQSYVFLRFDAFVSFTFHQWEFKVIDAC